MYMQRVTIHPSPDKIAPARTLLLARAKTNRAAGQRIALSELVVGGAPTSRSLILVTPDGQRTMNTFLGISTDLDHGEVEFIARFADDKGRELSHHERSTFVRRDGRWYFVDGVTPKQAPTKRTEPCPCGSGKKYKKCHGR
mgnify:CR=1 FL=1